MHQLQSFKTQILRGPNKLEKKENVTLLLNKEVKQRATHVNHLAW